MSAEAGLFQTETSKISLVSSVLLSYTLSTAFRKTFCKLFYSEKSKACFMFISAPMNSLQYSLQTATLAIFPRNFAGKKQIHCLLYKAQLKTFSNHVAFCWSAWSIQIANFKMYEFFVSIFSRNDRASNGKCDRTLKGQFTL